MGTLSPKDAVDAAISVYTLQYGSARQMEAFPNLWDRFLFEDANTFSSKTGAFFLKSKTGFGVMARGKDDNCDEAIITIRGTASAYDWVTDANVGIQLSSTGRVVHAGFNRTFKEFLPDLQRFFIENDISKVHCVGHSLGGALAGLAADYISEKNLADVNLYTFGSPRIGYSPFANNLTKKIGSDNIYRVHHKNDIVSLVPVWPFTHIPSPGISCCIDNHGYSPISAHYKDNYGASMDLYPKWSGLRTVERAEPASVQIEKWLSMDTLKVFSSYTVSMISKAIQYILKAAGIAVQAGFSVGFTVLDQLSYALERAYKVSKEVAGWIEMLMKKILELTGAVYSKVMSITGQFIRWVMGLLMSAIRLMVTQAVRGNF